MRKEKYRPAIDAGATAVLCHGIPQACAIEVYRGKPIFHSLANFIFHSRNPQRWNRPAIWEGIIGVAVLRDSRLEDLRLLPILLVDADGREDVPYEARRYPVRVLGQRAEKILDRVATDSSKLGTSLESENGTCVLHLE